jgi:hypothetical protein
MTSTLECLYCTLLFRIPHGPVIKNIQHSCTVCDLASMCVKDICSKRYLDKNNLFLRMEKISHSFDDSVELPATKDIVTREKEANGVEAEEELGIFQLIDREEEVTCRLTSR